MAERSFLLSIASVGLKLTHPIRLRTHRHLFRGTKVPSKAKPNQTMPLPAAPTTLQLAEHELESLAIFPLPSIVLLPHALLPLHIFEPRHRAMTIAAIADDLPIAMTLPLGGELDAQGRPRVHPVAGVGKVLQHESLPDGRYNILLYGLARVQIERELEVKTPYRQVQATLRKSQINDEDRLVSLLQSVHTLTLGIRAIDVKIARELANMMDERAGKEAVVDRLASMFFPDYRKRQTLLEQKVVEVRLAHVVERMAQYLVQLRTERGGREPLPN